MPSNKIVPGIIRLGKNVVSLYPNTGCKIDNHGVIVFKGRCHIGNDSSISVGKTGKLEFGDSFNCTTSMKIACYNSIKFGENVEVGWDCLFMDTDFHRLTRDDGTKTKGYGSINIGDNVWFGCGCRIFKQSVIPSKCVVSAQTIISETLNGPERSILWNPHSIQVKANGYYRDYKDDKIDYTIE